MAEVAVWAQLTLAWAKTALSSEVETRNGVLQEASKSPGLKSSPPAEQPLMLCQ